MTVLCLGAGGFEHISLLLKRVGWNVFTHGTHKLLLLEPPRKKENLPPVFEWKNIKIQFQVTLDSGITLPYVLLIIISLCGLT